MSHDPVEAPSATVNNRLIDFKNDDIHGFRQDVRSLSQDFVEDDNPNRAIKPVEIDTARAEMFAGLHPPLARGRIYCP